MASYFRSRGLPVPRELSRNPLTDWQRWGTLAVTIAVLYVGVKVLDIDVSRANPQYAWGVVRKLLEWDFDIMTPQNEYETFWDTSPGLMLTTILLGVVATALSLLLALPLAFLGARNIMTGHPVTAVIYTFVRILFTIVRSIDVLIVVIVFAIIFGLGSAAGVFGLAFHNIGVLGKLYSEAIEGIDPGPGEAITSTGANRVQVIWTAVLPQIFNPFVSFTIYRLDANVRLAPVLGFVGGGGIGQQLFQTIQLFQYQKAGLIIFMIVLVVATMDFASAQVRKKLS